MKNKRVCQNCGKEVSVENNFCENCGVKYEEQERLRFKIKLPVFTNKFVWINLFKGFFIPLVVIGVILGSIYIFIKLTRTIGPLTNPNDIDGILYMYVMICMTFGLSAFVSLFSFGNYKELTYELNVKGIKVLSKYEVYSRNRFDRLCIWLAVINCGDSEAEDRNNKTPDKQVGSVYWKEIKNIEYHPDAKAIKLDIEGNRKLIIYCSDKFYEKVEATVKKYVV